MLMCDDGYLTHEASSRRRSIARTIGSPHPDRAILYELAVPIVFGAWVMRHREFVLVRIDADDGTSAASPTA